MNARLETSTLVTARADQSLGEIAVQLPGATAAFRRFKLDYCCAGQTLLRQATHDRSLDRAAVLRELAPLTHDATPPLGASNTWRALYRGVAQLGEDLMKHIHLENNVLFPQFETASHSPHHS